MGVLSDRQLERDFVITPPPAREQQGKGVISSGFSSYGVDIRVGHLFRIFTPTHCVEIDPKNFDPRSFDEIDLTPGTHDWRPFAESMRDPVNWHCLHCTRKEPFLEGQERPHVHPDEPCPGLEQPENFVRIPPNSFALAESVEWFEVPRDCLGIIIGKSSYARCGLIVNCTPMEPEWTGKLTIELSNTTPLPLRVYAGEGIAQVYLLRTDGRREALENAIHSLLVSKKLTREEIDNRLTEDLLKAPCRVSYKDRRGRYDGQQGIVLPFVQTPEGTDNDNGDDLSAGEEISP